MDGLITSGISISEEELGKFHEQHLSEEAIKKFTPLTPPTEDITSEDVLEEEDLGTYPDGTQRTLTDEQIRLFRQSELKELLRNWQKHKATAERNGVPPVFSVADPSKEKRKAADSNDKRKKKQRKEVKPDLRKRTWDVVDTGLDSLEYD